MTTAIRAFRSHLLNIYQRVGTFHSIARVLAKCHKRMKDGLQGDQLRRMQPPAQLSAYVDQMTADSPNPRARDADAETGRNAPQQQLWQLFRTLALAGTSNVHQFFVFCLWLALVDVAELVVSGDVEQESDYGSDDGDPPNTDTGNPASSSST